MSPRRWRLWSLSRGVWAYVVLVEVVAVATVAATIPMSQVTRQHWVWFGLLAVGSVTHLEAVRGIEQMREAAAEGAPYTHLQSVWVFAGVLLLPLPAVAALIVISYAYAWVRVYRCRALAYRKVFSAATLILAAAAAGAVLSAFDPGRVPPFTSAVDGPIGVVAVVAAGCLYWLVNYALVVGAIVASNPGRPGRDALGSASNQLAVAGAIGLGAGMAVVMSARPWWTPLVIATVLCLHSGLLLPQFRAANTDGKTGLLDPTFWSRLLAGEIDRARRFDSGVGLLILDLDHFKQINDTHGHLAGDLMLRAVADTIRHSVRGYDHICRYGGEEFAVMFPGLGADQVVVAAERIRLAIAALTITTEDVDGATRTVSGLTASVGTAVFPDHGQDRPGLLLAADTALYEAKAAGRNCTRRALHVPVGG